MVVAHARATPASATHGFRGPTGRELRGLVGDARACPAVPRHAAAAADSLFPGSLDPDERADYEAALASARATLGEEAFTAAWEAGQALGAERAIDAALATCGSITAPSVPGDS